MNDKQNTPPGKLWFTNRNGLQVLMKGKFAATEWDAKELLARSESGQGDAAYKVASEMRTLIDCKNYADESKLRDWEARLLSTRSATGAIPGAIKLAVFLHDTYERLAPEYGYETKPETRVFNASSPNGKLMIAVCRELQHYLQNR